jgi:hypothetical protein
MKVFISKKEYRKLLDILFIADWIMNASRDDEGEETKDYKELTQKFFSLAKDYGYDDLIEYENGEYWETRKFEVESPSLTYIREYEEEDFWDKLIDRLSERDLEEKYGSEILSEIYENEEIYYELEGFKQKYLDEFSIFGFKRLKIEKYATEI